MGEFKFTSGDTEIEKAEPLFEAVKPAPGNTATGVLPKEEAENEQTASARQADPAETAAHIETATHTQQASAAKTGSRPRAAAKPAAQNNNLFGSAAFLSVLAEFPIAMTVIIAFLLWGFLWDGFYVSWTLFLLIPIFHSVIEAIGKRDIGRFAYPVLVTFVYCLLGLLLGAWHPYWILFLTIPVFYTVVSQLKKR